MHVFVILCDRFYIHHMFHLIIAAGLVARQRKGELQRVNEQLRQINTALRRQAKIESYAPGLSYAPVGKVVESEVIVDPKKQELISHLKAGKSFLRSQNPEKAFFEFKAALELAQKLKDPTDEKKAARGLGKFVSSPQRLYLHEPPKSFFFSYDIPNQKLQVPHCKGRVSIRKPSSIIPWC